MDTLLIHKHVVAQSENGKEVYAYLIQPPLSHQLSRNPHLITLIKEVIKGAKLEGRVITLETDMGRDIGHSDVVKVDEGDAVFYAKQIKQDVYTKFVKNHPTKPTSFLTFRLERDENDCYEIKEVWIGKSMPYLPGEMGANKKSEAYWSSHAVVYNGQPLMTGTITKELPQ